MAKKKSNKIKIIIPVISLFLVIGILCGVFVLPRLQSSDIIQMNLCQGEQKGYDFAEGYKAFVKTASGTLYINEKTSAVVITDKAGNAVFNSLSNDAAKNRLACVLSLTIRDKIGNAYIENSSINSAEYGAFEISNKKKNSVTVTFSFMAEKAGEVTEKVPVKFSESNGGIKVEVDTRQVTLKDGYCIEKISILPGLFSENKPVGECFYTVPDGCGVQVDLTARADESYTHTLDVYGSDITFAEYSQGATLPCFAMTKEGVMVTTVIEDGDALSSLTIKRNKNIGGNLYNTFTITPYAKINGRLIKGESYDGVVSQTYYLTDSEECNYNTISFLMRDNLIKRGYLPSKLSETFVDYPFFITAIGSENGKNNSVYTTFENASEMIALLKSRGVRSVALRFAGAGKNGLNSGAKNGTAISSTLGGVTEYNKLCSVASEKNSTVWYDVNLAATPSKSGSNKNDIYKEFREYLSKDYVNSRIGTYNYAYSNISKVYKAASGLESGNVCINDLSYFLFTDVISGVNRQLALENLKEKTQSLGVNGGIMLSQPAIYLMNQADAVFSVTQRAALSEYAGVKIVPLLQMVLHGSVVYGSEPINLFADSETAVLKAVEYGASPSFIFTHDNCAVLDYGVFATQTAKFYSSVKRMLPLMDMKITSHEQVVSGVYKITYDYSKVVYVNYNPSVVEVNGILVSAKDFVVI